MSALVEPGASLTAAEQQRYSRHILLPEIGAIGQRRLKNARVLVIGAGGLGSPVLLYLAAAGVGTLGIVDDDVVDLSNLQRQVIHRQADVARPKTASARDAIARLNPLVDVREHDTRLTAANAREVCAGYDLVVDGSDTFATRYLVSDTATLLGIPCVWGALSQFGGQVSVFHGPSGPSYRDLFPEAPQRGSAPSCAEGGVFGMLCAVVGGTMVAEVVKLVTGVGRSLLGRVLLFDALDASWREIGLTKDPHAPVVTELVDAAGFCGTSERDLTVQQLVALLDDRGRGLCDFDLIDVREPQEFDLARIPGARSVPQSRIGTGLQPTGTIDLNRDRDIVLHCTAGSRSAAVLAVLLERGYTRVRHVPGGMRAWAAHQTTPHSYSRRNT
ncbi:molybdopterin biosynthesis-like protein MoeZ [Cryobacterium roopkundense]|uniref:Adenylyltransferase/sulfurtransferase n=1 Tax=Cryobacterium roopkundense TaxID=1001240 RepID=A0A099JH21_9MICO|nr:molybdopterin-synthase adenylyltransferase MoeB [Cryobacterium roopkundense]KGJ77511.1 molybdopterin biosynthesis-like protein MoeZ [Cryobacterium roopkundense]MBB5642571.1 adenylyltransferase/sulfurtransferase [Cryobacterium roopkundense]